MPSPEVRELVDRWLAYARDDLRAAEELNTSQLPSRIACFHAHQAAEKALKAVFVLEQIDFPYTHDRVKLAETLPPSWSAGADSGDLADLSRWAVESRYPMLDEPESADSERALRTARAVVEGLTRKIASGAEQGNG